MSSDVIHAGILTDLFLCNYPAGYHSHCECKNMMEFCLFNISSLEKHFDFHTGYQDIIIYLHFYRGHNSNGTMTLYSLD